MLGSMGLNNIGGMYAYRTSKAAVNMIKKQDLYTALQVYSVLLTIGEMAASNAAYTLQFGGIEGTIDHWGKLADTGVKPFEDLASTITQAHEQATGLGFEYPGS